MIKYIGSKRVLVPFISDVVGALSRGGSVLDLFSGTSRVGHALKNRGHTVISNDLNRYAHTLATCYVQADAEDVVDEAQAWLDKLSKLPGKRGYFTRTFCEESRFFQPKNGQRVDAIRTAIQEAALPTELEAVLLVSLMEAADRVDSTTGVQMAYLKQWARRSHNDLELRLPKVLPRGRGKSRALCADALQTAREVSCDIAYLDPPYNQHKYLGNYHIWETLVRWDAPEPYGKACKRIDCKQRKSPYNSKRQIHEALAAVVDTLDAEHLVVSFSNEGFVNRDEMIQLLSRRGPVWVLARPYKRYVGAQIGIHNPSGDKVGEVSHLSNKEFVFVVPSDPKAERRLLQTAPDGLRWSRPDGQALF